MQIISIPAAQTWSLRHQVMWPHKPLDYVVLPNDDAGTHYGLFVEGQLTSVVSLFIGVDGAQFRKFATKQNAQGKGYGTALLKHVFEEVKKQQQPRIWCNARVDKCHYYARFGMGETAHCFIKGGIQYRIMEKLL